MARRGSRSTPLTDILDGSFDAGFLVDERGKVKHANEAAMDLFQLQKASHMNVEGDLEFWTYSNGEFVSRDPMTWKEVSNFLTRGEAPLVWTVTCFAKDQTSFVSAAKLTRVIGNDGHVFVIICVRSGGEGSDLRKQRQCPATRIAPAYVFDESNDPLMAIDSLGNIMMFNQAAVEQIDWCAAELVGQHISVALKHSIFDANPDPALSIDEDGIITAINESALDNMPWCTMDLIGTHLLQLKDHEEYVDSLHSGSVGLFTTLISKLKVSSHSRATETTARNRIRRRSPLVLRVFIRLARDDDSNTFQGQSTSISGDHSSVRATQDSLMMAVVEASLDPLFQINEKGIIQMANKAAVRQFGYSRSELLGSNISIIVGGGMASNHDSYIQHYLKTGITKVIGKKRGLTARRADGSEFPIELAVVEVDTFAGDERMFCGFVHDLSSMKKKDRLTTDIVEASLDPMFLIDEAGRIKMVNQRAVTTFGYPREELLNGNIAMIVGGGHAKKHDEYIKRYLESGITKVIGKRRELPARRRDGTEFPILLGVVEMKTLEDEQRMFVGYVHDLNEVRQHESISTGIIESSMDPMFQIDDQGTIEMVNTAACELFRWSRGELMGASITIIVPMLHTGNHETHEGLGETGQLDLSGQRREMTAKKKDGCELLVEIYMKPVKDAYSKRTKFCGFLRNVTASKRKEPLTKEMIE